MVENEKKIKRIIVYSMKYPIRRIGLYPSFRYLWRNGTPVHEKRELHRIRFLAIPPAYRNVKIYAPQDKIQATGIDAKKRIQYRYHPDWIKERERKKFHNLIAFNQAYPKLRKAIVKLLPSQGPPTNKEELVALATAVIHACHIRPGNNRHLKNTGSYGATTLKKKHIHSQKGRLIIRFKGKSGVVNVCKVPKIGKVHNCLSALYKMIPQKEDRLFQLPGVTTQITHEDINLFMKEAGGEDISAKGFRTYHANLRFLQTIQPYLERRDTTTLTERRTIMKSLLLKVSEELHHTPAIFKKSYLFPPLRELYINDPTKFRRLFYKKNVDEALSRFLKKHTLISKKA
jgi:DNA topoisomerase-1